MKVFLTGATGFIGHYTARELLQAGHSVTCLVRSPQRLGELIQMGVRPLQGDIRDAGCLSRGMQGADWVIHLAGVYAMWHPHPAEFEQVNVEGTRAVMQAALQSGAGRVIHMSTVAVFGKPAGQPFTEESPRGPRLFSCYAASKAAGEQIAWQLQREHGLPLTVLYPGIVLGAGDDRASGDYIRLILFGRTPSTIFHHSPATYVHVRDVAQAVRLAAESQTAVGRGYLLGKETLTGSQYAALIANTAGVRLPLLRLPDPLVLAASYLFTALSAVTRRPPLWTLSIDAGRTLKNGFSFDGSRAERELGLRYTPIREAMREAVDQYRREKMGQAGKAI